MNYQNPLIYDFSDDTIGNCVDTLRFLSHYMNARDEVGVDQDTDYGRSIQQGRCLILDVVTSALEYAVKQQQEARSRSEPTTTSRQSRRTPKCSIKSA